MDQKELVLNYTDRLGEELKKLCPNMSTIADLLTDLRGRVEADSGDISEYLDQLESLLDAELFWSSAS